jgi:hypothetical protein
LIKNGLGYILGNFLTNASGHPGVVSEVQFVKIAKPQNTRKVENSSDFNEGI